MQKAGDAMALREAWGALQAGVQRASPEDRDAVLEAHLASFRGAVFIAEEFEEVLQSLEEGETELTQEERAKVRSALIRAGKSADGTSGRTRRLSQDYSALFEFLLEDHWAKLLEASSQDARAMAGILSQFAFDYLGLRLPSGGTFASMTGVICLLLRKESHFDMSTTLETTKNVWRNFARRKKLNKDTESALLPHLPSTFDLLPETLRMNVYGEARPCPDDKRPFTLQALRSAACRVRLRKDKTAAAGETHLQLIARQAAAEATERLAFQMFRGSGEGDSLLKNLRIFPPREEAVPKASSLPLAVGPGAGSPLEALVVLSPGSKRRRLHLPAPPPTCPAEAESQGTVEQMLQCESPPMPAASLMEGAADMQSFNAALAVERMEKKEDKALEKRSAAEKQKEDIARKKPASAKAKAKCSAKAKKAAKAKAKCTAKANQGKAKYF